MGNKIFKYKGKDYSSLQKLANAVGIKRSTLFYRINKKGMSVEEAINPIRYKYNGKGYATFKELATDVGIPRSTLYSRMYKGMTIEEAIEYKI